MSFSDDKINEIQRIFTERRNDVMSFSDDKMPMISIIVPVYNEEQYIRACVEALLNQDYTNIEVILVNDGSSDSSQKLIDEAADKDSRIISVYQENAGVGTARNHGIKKSKGEYICFVDADDYVTSDYVSYMYKMIKNTGADISLVPHAKNFVGKVKETDFSAYVRSDKIKIYRGKEATKDLLYYHIKESCWSKLFSRKLIEESGIEFQSQLFCGEGFNFCLESFLKATKVAIGYKTIYYYRVDNPNSAMTKFNINLIRNGLSAIERIETIIKKDAPELLNACCYTKWHTNCDFLNNMIGCNKKNQYYEEYITMKKCCRNMAGYAIMAPVSLKDKLKGMAYWISPYIAAIGINRLRPRKFVK